MNQHADRDRNPIPVELVEQLANQLANLAGSDEDADGGNQDIDSGEGGSSIHSVFDISHTPIFHDVPTRQPPITNAPVANHGSWSSGDREALEDGNRRLSEEVRRLTEARDRLEREKADVEHERRRLEAEVGSLNDRLSKTEAELQRTQESYRALMDGEVEVEEPLSGPPKLPLEIMLDIAGFVAGDNNYGTLLSFCLMSRGIKEEAESIFYETVLATDLANLQREPGSDRNLVAYRYTKFVYVWGYDAFHTAKDHFPNIRALFLLSSNDAENVQNGIPPAAFLKIYRPVRLSTLFSIFRYPTGWGYHISVEQEPIQAVSLIVLEDDSYLVAQPGDLCFRNLSSTFWVNIGKRNEHIGIGETLRELACLDPALPNRSERGGNKRRPTFGMQVHAGTDFDACLINLPDIIRRQPHFHLEIRYHRGENQTRDWFKSQCLDAAAVYRRIWSAAETRRLLTAPEDTHFFTLNCETTRGGVDAREAGEAGRVVLMGNFVYQLSTDSFHITMVEYVLRTGDQTVFYDRPYFIQSVQAQG